MFADLPSFLMRLILLFLALTAVASAKPKNLELGFPGLAHRIHIIFPENYDGSRKWPLMLHYHGTNGKPETNLYRHHTKDQDWFIVGMTYVQRGKFTFTPENLEKELTILRSVRHHLISKYNVDPQQTYVSGFSKGGWLAGLFLQAEPQLAGAVIMGAGHVHQVKSKPSKFRRPTPVFLGIGRQDGNYPFALKAITFYRGLGATTTLNTWPDLGHSFPDSGSPALAQWLHVVGNPDTNHTTTANNWSTTALADLKDIDDPIQRWVALLDLQACPYFSLLDKSHKAAFLNAKAELEKSPTVAPEAKALTAHRKLLATEISTRTKEHYKRMLREYTLFSRSIPNTRQGKIAQQDADRISTLLKHFDQQELIRDKERAPFESDEEERDDPFNPSPKPNDRLRIPGNPLIR